MPLSRGDIVMELQIASYLYPIRCNHAGNYFFYPLLALLWLTQAFVIFPVFLERIQE